ncbi:MAG TPA: glycan-binding surface protein [Flavisolibacter sp.]|nr:glycan-binding surface protein [Flavisolibacter sp.]
MKRFNKTILMLCMAIAMAGMYASCKKDNSSEDGTPRITYVRVTNPVSSDSLLVGAGQGQLIAIVGEHLQDAVEIWFNDQRAVLTPTYITATTILVSVPSKIPTDINNILKIVFKNGKTLEHKFQVQISKPAVSRMVSEYVNTGDVAIITGDYFYAPLVVTFTGGATGEIVSIKDKEVQVRVPAGAQPGPITVKTNFGETESEFWFRDNRNIFISGDPHEGWWATYLVTTPGAGNPPKISGNYYHFRKLVKAWVWDNPEVAGGAADAMPNHAKNIPDEAILKPELYNFKFEINTLKPYSSNRIVFNLGLSAEDNNAYAWNPPYDSKGQWNTVIIPFEDVVKSYAVKPVVNPNGYWSRILVFGPGDLDADIAFDNFRVVPKINP